MLDLGDASSGSSEWAATALALTAILLGVLAGMATRRAAKARRQVEAVAQSWLFHLEPVDQTQPGTEEPSWEQLLQRVRDESGVDKDDLRRIEERVAAIEERFPHAATIDKVASVNDAILATRVESLEREVGDLRASTLTEWQVAGVVFKVLSLAAALVAAAVLFVPRVAN